MKARLIGLGIIAGVTVIVLLFGYFSKDASSGAEGNNPDPRNDRTTNQQIYQRERQGGTGASGGK